VTTVENMYLVVTKEKLFDGYVFAQKLIWSIL